jgi:hypothetical protein
MTLRMWLRLANQCCDRHSSRKRAVEALDVGVLHRLAGLDEAQLDAVAGRPGLHRPARELRAVVGADDLGQAAFGLDLVEKHCPGIITQVSTGGRSGAGCERGAMLSLKPGMASLTTGSVNFPTRVYDNAPDLVEWLAAEMQKYSVKPEVEAFDLSMIFQAVNMEREGKITGPLHVQFVMGVKNAMPVDREVFEFYVKTLKRLAPDATWTGTGIGRDQLKLAKWSLELGSLPHWP